MRLDKFLAEKNKNVSRGKIQRAIKDGLVLVNGKKVVEPDFQVSANDRVELPKFAKEELKPSEFPLKVVFENQDLAVIDKPAGLVVYPVAGHKQDTLANALLKVFPYIKKVGDPKRPGIVHRLDEDTSGLLLVAKNAKSFEYLKHLFLERQIEKEYLALVHGVPEKLHGIVDVPIGKTSTHQKMSAFANPAAVAKATLAKEAASRVGGKTGVGKEAMTEFWVLATSDMKNAYAQDRFSRASQSVLDQYALLKVKLHTGRTHQIRVHMAHIGHPVVGDQLYGGQFKNRDLELIGRQFLHAYRLKFRLSDGSWLELFSELPEDLRQALDRLNLKY